MAEFRIISAPVKIAFECPYCEAEVEIPWKQINAPDYWGDDWPEVTCPECGRDDVVLGDWVYD